MLETDPHERIRKRELGAARAAQRVTGQEQLLDLYRQKERVQVQAQACRKAHVVRGMQIHL
jgi:hypothetical protein